MAVVFLTAPVLAQTGSARVQVYDGSTSQPLPGATVVLSNAQRLIAPIAGRADRAGRADFPVLRAGRGYRVEVSMPGFATRAVADITVEAGRVTEIPIALTAAVAERVEVSAESRVVDVDSLGNTSRFTDDFIQSLPVPGRFYQNTLTLAPGVNDADGDGNPNVHGARSRDFKAVVSGVSNVDPLTGEWLSYVNPESIEVMEIVTSGAGVEFGRAQGGFARIVQKQGTNRFEGVASMIFRTSRFDNDGAATGTPDGIVPSFTWRQPAVQVSGPLVRDKLWYRLSHEWLDREEPVDTLGSLVPTRREQKIFADQLTWQVSPRNKLALQYQYDPLTVEGLGLSSTVPFESTSSLERGGSTWSLTWTAPASARFLGEAVVAYQDHSVDILPTRLDQPQSCVNFYDALNISPRPPGWESLRTAFCHRSLQGNSSGTYPESSRDDRQRLTVHGKATRFAGRFAGASHRLQIGLIVENERYFRELERTPEVRRVLSPKPSSPCASPLGPLARRQDQAGRLCRALLRQDLPRGTADRARALFDQPGLRRVRPLHRELAGRAGLRRRVRVERPRGADQSLLGNPAHRSRARDAVPG